MFRFLSQHDLQRTGFRQLLLLAVCCFDQDIAEESVTGHLIVDQAAEIADVRPNVVQDWAHKGLLKPVSGPKVDQYHRNLFRRKDVERLQVHQAQ